MKLHYSIPQMKLILLNTREDILLTSGYPSSLEDMVRSDIDIVDRVEW